MKSQIIQFLVFLLFVPLLSYSSEIKIFPSTTETIVVYGGEINRKFVQYIIELTEKTDPKICFLPTAAADHKDNIAFWNSICRSLSIEPYVLKVWVSSMEDTVSFKDILLQMDAIVVGGGNTLNMMGIWQAQGIDNIMEDALKNGIILAGGSAGSICWFDNGISDSRPANLSIVDGLGFLPYSNCPHYNDTNRKNLYHRMIMDGEIKPGYASDDLSGILFKNGEFIESFSINEINNSYYISSSNGVIKTEKLDTRFLIDKNALQETEYTITEVNMNLKRWLEDDPNNALANSFGSFITKITSGNKQNQGLETIRIFRIFNYNDILVAVMNDQGYGFYNISYFYHYKNEWINAGEDMGTTPVEVEISFRERLRMHLNRLKSQYN